MVADLTELKQKSKIPANQAGGSIVKEFFEANKSNIAAVMPKHMTPDRMVRIALGALRANPKLMECTTESLVGAVMQCAQLGLEPNTPLGHAYLIPFNNRKANRTDVQVIFGFRGLIDLARRSGQIISIDSHVVFENDDFEFSYGLDSNLVHKPKLNVDRGSIIGVYAVAKLKDGGHQFEVMSRNDIDHIMLQTQSKGKYGPWHDHYTEMMRKTAIRRLFKYLPVSIELAQASAIDEVASVGGNQHLETVLDGDFTVMPEDYESTEAEPEALKWPEPFTDPESGDSTWIDSEGAYFDIKEHLMDTNTKEPKVTNSGAFHKRPKLK